jgi:hypothetical protein
MSIGVVVVVVVEDVLEGRNKKTYFHAFTHTKKIVYQQQQGLDLDYLTRKMKVFPLFLICQDRTECMTKRVRRKENTFHSIYDFLRSHIVQGKDLMQIGKSSNPEMKKKTEM